MWPFSKIPLSGTKVIKVPGGVIKTCWKIVKGKKNEDKLQRPGKKVQPTRTS